MHARTTMLLLLVLLALAVTPAGCTMPKLDKRSTLELDAAREQVQRHDPATDDAGRGVWDSRKVRAVRARGT